MVIQFLSKVFKRIPLKTALIILFITLAVVAAGMVGYLSYRNGQRAVNDVAHQLRNEIISRIETHLSTFVSTPLRINQLNASSIQQGLIDVNNQKQMERHFWLQIKAFEFITSVYFGNNDGGLVNSGREGATYSQYVIVTDNFKSGPFKKFATDNQGNRTNLLVTVPNFDARTRQWYIGAVEEGDDFWSPVYILFTGHDMAIAASRPVYDEQHKLLGVVSVDLFLSHITHFLKSLTIGKKGHAFIIERSGLLIASSDDEKPLIESGENNKKKRRNATESKSPVIRSAAKWLTQSFDKYHMISKKQNLKFEIDGQRNFLQVSPILNKYGLDWLIAVVVPEADFMDQIKVNNRVTAFLILIIVSISILIGVFLAQKIAEPILRLKDAALSLTKGELEKEIYDNSLFIEISVLTQSFNQMASQLRQMLSSLNNEIEERKQVERGLRESEERYRQLTEFLPLAIFEIDNDGNITLANKSALHSTGYTQKDIKNGLNMLQVIDPEDHNRAINMSQQVMQGSVTDGAEYFVRRKDGSTLPGFINTRPKGSSQGLMGYIFDLTTQKKTENELREKEEELQRILDTVQAGIVIIDQQTHTIVDVNPAAAALIGIPKENIIDKICHNYICPADKGACPITDLRQKVDRSERTLITAAGKEIPILKTVTPINLNGKKCLIEVFVDMSDKKEAEEQLLQAQKMEAIGTLAGGIAHDFNNILSPLVGYTEMLKEDLPADHPFQENADTMLSSALRAKDLVQQILTFSRKTESEVKPLKLQLILKEAIKLLRPSIPKTIEIDQSINSNCGPVNADPTKIHQIIMNLATNAYHAMEEDGGKLTITLDQVHIEQDSCEYMDLLPGIYACLTITDTGIGMAKDVIDKAFDPYFTTKEQGKGTGLGLSVVHGIIKEYNGGIHIVSEPGKGTKICVYLPVIERRAEKRVKTEETVIGGTEKILLVDDEEAVVRMEERMLERLGYQVTTRTGSIEALEAFKANFNKFDLIVTDMTMPNMTGLQLAKKIKTIKPDIPIIICTGFSDQLTDEKCQAMGIQGYIMKPVIIRELAGKIRKVLDVPKRSS